MLLALKIALVIAVSGLVVFTGDYTRMTRGACWTDPVGQTIIIAEVLALGTFMPLLLAAFFQFSTLSSEVWSWVLIVFLALGGVAMWWRTWVFERIRRRAKAPAGKETAGDR